MTGGDHGIGSGAAPAGDGNAEPGSRLRRVTGPAARVLRRGGAAARRNLVAAVGGPARTRVVIVMACVLALASADTATVGASAVELRRALGISNTDIGLLVTVTAVVGAVFSLPFGVLADRSRRTWILAFALVTWGAAMLWSATASSFGQLLLARLCLGAVTAAAGPVTASLIGDWFPAAERGRIYGYILTGELLGAGVGFAVTGDIAALSWRAAFVILALPAFILAWLVIRLPEPARGGQGALADEPGGRQVPAAQRAPAGTHGSAQAAGPADAQRLAAEQGIEPDRDLAGRAATRMTFSGAVRYILAVRTNVALVISGACGYYFLAGVQTFGAEFVGGQYRIGQVAANLLLLVVGAGAVAGVLAAGPASDALLRRGHLTARVTTAAVAATAAVLLFVPALITHSALTALPYVVFAAAALTAQNPPIDAARLDIMPPWLWGRAEGVRTFLRTAAQALAPVLFGTVSDYVFGGGTAGLRWTFVVMLAPLAASAAILYRARRLYPADVATTAAAVRAHGQPAGRPAGPPARQGQSGQEDNLADLTVKLAIYLAFRGGVPMASKRPVAWRAQITARVVELRPVVLALMRESVPDELQGFGQATGRQLQALARLPEDGMTMGELAAFLKVTGAAASVLAERLVAQGLAVRHADPADRRVVRLAPTPAGMAVARQYRDNQLRAVAALLDRLSDAQVAAWLDIIETLAGADPGPAAARAAEPAGAIR